jgi:hypothetical protein
MVSNGPLRSSGGLRAREPDGRRDILLSAMVQSSKTGVSIVLTKSSPGILRLTLTYLVP